MENHLTKTCQNTKKKISKGLLTRFYQFRPKRHNSKAVSENIPHNLITFCYNLCNIVMFVANFLSFRINQLAIITLL